MFGERVKSPCLYLLRSNDGLSSVLCSTDANVDIFGAGLVTGKGSKECDVICWERIG